MEMNRATIRAVLAMTIASAFAAAPASAQVVYTTLDHPLAGAGGTIAQAIDGTRIVGSYFDVFATLHGFAYDTATGAWTTLDPPGAVGGTSAWGVSGNRVSGEFRAVGGQAKGYLYDGATWTSFEHPPTTHAGLDTFARGTDGTTVVGFFLDDTGTHSFAYDGVTFTDVRFPGSDTFAFDVDAGRIVGSYNATVGRHGFIFDGTDWRTVDYPGSDVFATHLFGIDGDNVVGFYQTPPNGQPRGFLYNGADFIPIDFPGATETAVYGIDADRIVGSYVDANRNRHAFIAVVPEPSCLGIAALCLGWRLRTRR
jgi:hypothetical protein